MRTPRNGDQVPDDRLGADPRAREGSQSADGTGEHRGQSVGCSLLIRSDTPTPCYIGHY